MSLTASAQQVGDKVKDKADKTSKVVVKQMQRAEVRAQREVERAERDAERAVRSAERARRHAEVWDEEEQAKTATVVRLKLERSGRLVINNWSGDITVTGIDGDTLEARALDDDGALAPLEHRVSGTTIFIGSEAKSFRRGGSADIEVKVPRYAAQVDVEVLSGDLTVKNLDGGVKTNTVSGEITIQCVKGRVNATSISGSIELHSLAGDVVSETVSGSIDYRGDIRPSGSYRLKSMSGEVAMWVQADAPGFTATLTTFSGELETVFPLKIEKSSQFGGNNRQLVGRYGDGGATLSLNSFSGSVRITKAAGAAKANCN